MVKKDNDLPEVSPLIMLQDVNVEGIPTPEGMRKVFVSYNVLTLQTGQMGFGNTIALFNKMLYAEGNIEKFISDLQKSIQMAIQEKTGYNVTVQVLFFR